MSWLEDSVFPQIGESGIDTLTYFAARAPHDAPTWFQPVMPARPALPEIPGELPDLTRELLHGWRQDPCWDAGVHSRVKGYPAAVAWIAATHLAWQARNAWDRDRKIQAVAQWPWTWARLVLDARSRG
jgi:hypothetical protein